MTRHRFLSLLACFALLIAGLHGPRMLVPALAGSAAAVPAVAAVRTPAVAAAGLPCHADAEPAPLAAGEADKPDCCPDGCKGECAPAGAFFAAAPAGVADAAAVAPHVALVPQLITDRPEASDPPPRPPA